VVKPVKKGDRLYRVCADGPSSEPSVESRVISSIKTFDDTTYVEIRIDVPFAQMYSCAFNQSLIDRMLFRTAREAICAFDRDCERVEIALHAQLERTREARRWATAQLDTIE